MKVNYIILAHKEPRQLSRLVSRLRSDEIHFYIHVDKKCNIEDFTRVLPEDESTFYIKDRKDCRWGDLSLVEAVVTCYREIVKRKDEGFCVLLSAQDYPLRSPEYIKNFFDRYAKHNFINIYPIPDPKKKSENGGLERLISYTFDCKNPKDPRMKAKIKPLSLRLKTIGGFVRMIRYRRDLLPLAIKLYFVKRKYPEKLTKCFNEMWVALNYDTIVWLLKILDAHPEYWEYYRYTHIPDETMFGAILYADENVRNTLRPMCHYICWEEGEYGSPKTLDMKDVENIKKAMDRNSQIMFARKFIHDTDILDYIDAHFIR